MPGKQPIEKDNENTKSENGRREMAVRNEKNLKMELQYLSDPLKHADHVRYTLRQQKPEKALDLCRLASKKESVIVSWNHCVDWHMTHGKIDAAIKIYNEMKKRAQFPDSYTYVLLLRGLAKGHHHGQVVKQSNVTKALSIYNSMNSPTSRVKPSIYHTNAVLRVCSEALDMDALWGVASKIPSSGPGAPDRITYTTLLNAIRHGAYGKNPETVYLEQIAGRRHQAVQEGRRIWQEVVPKWRAGEIHIDEELVCTMAKLLLISRRMSDWDDVLNLVQQTMDISRLIAPLGDPDRHTEHVPQADSDLPEPEAEEDSEGFRDAPSTKAFRPVLPLPPDSAKPDRPTSLAWVQPGNHTLSVLIEACTLLRTPKTAVAYWDLLTSPSYNLKPDLANFHAQLKLLSKNRASAKAVSLVKEGMKAANVDPKVQTFRIAMSVCTRDNKNHNVLSHARDLVAVMEQTLADVDIHTLSQYLSPALLTDNGTTIVETLNRLDPIVHNLRSRVTYGTDTQNMAAEAHVRDKEEIITFFQSMVGVIDTLMNRGLVPRDDFTHWHGRRSQLDQFIRRAKNGVEKQRVKLGMEREEVERKKVAAAAAADGEGKRKGPQMSKAEWAVKVFKGHARREREVEARRQKAIGLKGWWDGSKRGEGGWGRRLEERGGGFADSPMELSAR